MYMSKNVMLSDEAYAALLKHKKPKESFSDVVKRFVPTPIRTFGDLEKHLENLDGPLFTDMEALRRVRARKSGRNAH
jgi:predicted CopG family antitoxin